MNCQAPVLGHSALRCAGLSRSQGRLQILPATFCLVGCLVILITWIKLALARRTFFFRQVIFLALCGSLDFILTVIAVQQSKDGAKSSTLGGMASLVCLFQLLALYSFLPPNTAIPGFIDRLLAVSFTTSIVLNILASSHHWQSPTSVDADGKYIIYAEAICLIFFYFACICASQFSRFFVLDNLPRATQHTSSLMSPLLSVTFLGSLVFFLAQICTAFSLFISFASVMTASTLCSFGYLLLVSTFVIQNKTIEKATPALDILPEVSSNAEQRHSQEEKVDDNGNTMEKDAPQLNENNLTIPDRRSRSASNVVGSEAGSIIWIGHAAPGSGAITRKASGSRPRRSKHIQSGLSMTSWDRVHYLMNSKRAHPRPASGLTYYGSESSFPEGVQTQRSSMMSSFAHAITGYGHHTVTIPPVPSIDPRHLRSTSQIELGFAQPLSAGEKPIPLSARTDQGPVEARPIKSANPKHQSLKEALSSLTAIFTSSHRLSRADESSKETQSMTTLVPTTSNEGGAINTTLPSQYQSSKLFPATEWQAEIIPSSAKVDSPNNSEVKHSERRGVPVYERDASEEGHEIEMVDGSYTYVNDFGCHSPSSSNQCKNTKEQHKTSLAEDQNVNLAGSIMFPRY